MDPNFQFPRVTLVQNFESISVGSMAILPTLLIGMHFSVNSYAKQGEAVRLDSADNVYSFDTGLTAVAYPNHKANAVLDIDSVQVYGIGLNAQYFTTQSFTVDVDVPNKLVFSETLKTGNGHMRASSVLVDVKVGDSVRLLDSEGGEALFFVLAILADPDTGAYNSVLLDAKPIGEDGFDKAEFSQILNSYIPFEYVVKSTTAIGLSPISLSITDTDGTVVENVPVVSGQFYAEYREALSDYKNKLGWVSGGVDSDAAVEEVLGEISPDNPLALATAVCARASGDRLVAFTAVNAETVAEYTEAMDYIAGNGDIYGILPAIEGTGDIAKALYTIVQSQSTQDIPKFRYLYLGISAPEDVLIKGDLVIASITNNVIVFDGASPLYNSSLAEGDLLRIQTGETVFGVPKYTYRTIVSSNYLNQVTLDTPFDTAPDVGTTVDIVRDVTTNSDIVSAIIANNPVSDRRVVYAFGDGCMYNGMECPGYVGAADVAGTRSSELPHRPLSNLATKAVQIKGSHGFSLSQLKLMGANGVWLLGNNEDGIATHLKQVTTAATGDPKFDEQSATTNADSICTALLRIGKDDVGNTNISPALLSKLETRVISTLNSFMVSQDAAAGPQLLSYTILEFGQDPVNLDHVRLTVSGTGPSPFNEFNITFNLI